MSNELTFKIEQIAFKLPEELCSDHKEKSNKLFRAIGAKDWVTDTVLAKGIVNGEEAYNVADLAFNYQLGNNIELEILDYKAGDNWVEDLPFGLTHVGMHVSAEELLLWRELMSEHEIDVAQEVNTMHHTNAAIAGKRSYNYVIFKTRFLLGFDMKFIVRKDIV